MSDKALVNGWLPKAQPDQDTSRSHAANWAAGVCIISFCGYVLGWCIAKVFLAGLPYGTLFLCVPVALVLGASWGGMKLITFTEEHRNFLYFIENETEKEYQEASAVIAEKRQISHAGEHPAGALVRGLDGQMKRINTRLTKADLHAVKASLLTNGTFGVRAINSLLGDETRASGLRLELHRLGILEQPKARQATRLTSEGIRAVRRWA